MNSSSSLKKSREEVEAERKSRKAAKQAAKDKSKTKDGDSVAGKSQSISCIEVQDVKGKKSNETSTMTKQKLVDSFKNLDISRSSVPAKLTKAPDEPDFVSPSAVQAHQELSELIKHEDVRSKADQRAERRAKQEAQRAAKTIQQQHSQQQQKAKQPLPISAVQKSSKPKAPSKSISKAVKERKDGPVIDCVQRRVKLFSHLYQNSFKSISHIVGVNHPQYHPAIVRLGVQYADRTILGSNARCIALLYALKEIVSDYVTPPEKEFSRGLEGYLHPNIEFLQQCRPQSVSMVNALRYFKWQLTQLSNSISDTEARQKLQEAVEQYIFEQIGKAAEAIGKAVKDKIADNDVILVYACSSLVLSALKVAFDEGRQFRVIVVDSLPWLEGKEMLRRLVSMGVRCSYVHISAASFVMREVSKVLLGAHALLANGYVMSRAGSSQVALLAHSCNVPVLVCCETHKFSERVQTDSFVYNELGDPDELIGARRSQGREADTDSERPLARWRDLPHLSLLNLVYDVTPPDLVTAVVTERAILPCTSVPVILRIKPIEC